MLTQKEVTALCAPFPASDHEFHRGFVYIGEEAITARIEAVDPSWELSLNWITNRESFSTAHVTLTICGVKRDGIGMATQEYSKVAGKPDKAIGEPEKSAATDALKRAARLFGIGRYLLDAPKDLTDANLGKWVAKITPKAAPDERPAQPEQIAAPAANAIVDPAPAAEFERRSVVIKAVKRVPTGKKPMWGVYAYDYAGAEYRFTIASRDDLKDHKSRAADWNTEVNTVTELTDALDVTVEFEEGKWYFVAVNS